MMSDEVTPLNETMTELLAEMRKVTAAQESGGKTDRTVEGKAKLAAALTDEHEKLSKKDRKAAKAKAAEAQAESDARLQRMIRDELHGVRSAPANLGKAKLADEPRGRRKASFEERPIKYFRQAFRGYKAGEFLNALCDYRGMSIDGIDPVAVTRGKAVLMELAAFGGRADQSQGMILLGRRDGDMIGKATLGTTGATGGYVLPNNLVDSVVKPNVQDAIYQKLCTVRNGVAVRGVDQPYRTGAPSRAQFSNWGAPKETRDEAYGSYTATLGTMALIYDVGKQYLRFSAGSAEEDVMDELAKAHRLGENYAVIAGPGTGSASPGVNDPTEGVYTALAAGAATYHTTTFTAANATVAGSAGKGFALMFKALAARSRRPTAVVVDALAYWDILGQGTDAAGFFVPAVESATTISGFAMGSDGTLRWHGVPVVMDANLDANSGQTGLAIAGEWDALKIYRGIEFRVDTSDQAGTRWDQNLVGFRGEQEFGLHAGTAVATGAFQYLTSLLP
jgi:HK97 family phage major capsid protein